MATEHASSGSDPARPVTQAGVTRAISSMVVAQLLSQISWSGSLVVLGSLLPPKAFGTVAIGMAIASVSMLLLESGTYGSIISTPRLTSQHFYRALASNCGIGLLGSSMIALLAQPIVENFAKGADVVVLRVLVFSIAIYAPSIAPISLMQKAMQFSRVARVEIAAATISSLVAVGGAFFGAGVWALVIRQFLYQSLRTSLAWWAAREMLPARTKGPAFAGTGDTSNRRRGSPFFVLAFADYVAFNADVAVIGRFTDATHLGLYSLAFTLAFAPLRQLSWQIGGVFFAASAATSDPETVRRQAVKAFRMTAVLMLPLVLPALTLARVFPWIFGDEWSGMVVPFQLLILAGVGHALLNLVGEFLSGTGNIGFRARASVAWAVGMVIALVVLVPAGGIRAAAAAHAALFVTLAAGYVLWGVPRLGLDARQLARATRSTVAATAVQAALTGLLVVALGRAGLQPLAAVVAANAVGLAVLVVLLWRADPSPLKEARALVLAMANRTG